MRRRRAEAALWRGLPKAVDAQQARTAPDLPQPPKPITRSKEANAAILAGGAGIVAAASEAMPVIREGVGIMPILVDVTWTAGVHCSPHHCCRSTRHLVLAPPASAGAGRMMFSWILSPLGRWLSLAGAVFATLGVAWLKGRAAGKAAWQAKRQAAKTKALTTSSEIRHDVQ